MSSIPQRLYNQVMMLDNFTCVYCGTRTCDVVVDHLIPSSQGGPNVIHNLVTACPKCNSRKRDHPLHTVRMQLRFGRFQQVEQVELKLPKKPRKARPARSAKTKPVIISRIDMPPIPPRLSNDEWERKIRDLAVQLTDAGQYRYSANAITKIAFGNRSIVLKIIRSARESAA
jgi:hypothetical protein